MHLQVSPEDIITIYGVRDAYDAECREWYTSKTLAEAAMNAANKKYPSLEYRIIEGQLCKK